MNLYHQFHIELLKQTYNQLLRHYPFNAADLMLQQQEFLDEYAALIELCQNQTVGYVEKGQSFCASWIRGYPDLAPLLPRDLLWFFGGDCLHFMPDEEIVVFQRLDEMRHEALSNNTDFNYPLERAKLLNLLH
ncbi:MAG: dehydrogenase [Oceanospirillaceae bacterium]|nr:dehydrogenase [Oceanospirillaceae bacterium]